MPSLHIDGVATLHGAHRAPPDGAGSKGYNVYHWPLRLGENSDTPVSIAVKTSDAPLWSGSKARFAGTLSVDDRSLFVIANDLTLVLMEQVDKTVPDGYLDLPHVTLDGVVSSPPVPDLDAPGSLRFEVTIKRPDVWPYRPVIVQCWMNRDIVRFTRPPTLPVGTTLFVSGIHCGWAHGLFPRIMVDVHDMSLAPSGPAENRLLAPPPPLWARANMVDGYALFHNALGPIRYRAGYTISVCAPPSISTPRGFVEIRREGVPIPEGWSRPSGSSTGEPEHPARASAVQRSPATPVPRNPTPHQHASPTASTAARASSVRAIPVIRIPPASSYKRAILDPNASRKSSLPSVSDVLNAVNVALDGASASTSPSSSTIAEPPSPRVASGDENASPAGISIARPPSPVISVVDVVMDDVDVADPTTAPPTTEGNSAANTDGVTASPGARKITRKKALGRLRAHNSVQAASVVA
ncbi:hypothetical protein AURDEDRAFT_182337 [Auricularia subglabra TFB-10046 SS5]|nr:hypothetical protein AURDEDRAFT_182337 [Auricularia subglabra TFB-10046 SS5]